MFTKSIRGRLLLWLAFLLVCILSGFGITAYQLHRRNALSQVDETLERLVAALSTDVRGRGPFGRPPSRSPFEPGSERPPPGSPRSDLWMQKGPPDIRGPRQIRLSAQTTSLFDEQDPKAFYYSIWSRDGTLLKASSNAPPSLPFPPRLDADTRPHIRTRDTLREAYHFTELGDCILAGRSIGPDLAALRGFGWWLVTAGGAVLAIGLGGGWIIASRAIRPVQQISAAARRISAGNLSDRIDVAETDSELGHLVGVLNSTFARLDSAFAEQKQFTADASHELRTPLAVIISESQTTLARERSAAEYRETIETCLDAAQQMRRLTESLLQLARFDAGQESMQYQRFNLDEAVQRCVSLVRPLAAQRGIQIQSDLAPVEVKGDSDRISQVITNLLTNSIQYNRDQGEVRTETRAENGFACLRVTDTGQGISPVDLPHIFERFYRGDKSRSGPESRNGLGLAIAKAIVDAHGGRIEVSSQPGAGTTFVVRLPNQSQ